MTGLAPPLAFKAGAEATPTSGRAAAPAALAAARSSAILVPDAHTRASLAAIRSLGRAGYVVHAASPLPEAFGLKSRYASATVVCPPTNAPYAADWMLHYCRKHDIRMVVPTSSTVAIALDRWDEFAPLLPISDDPDIVRRIFNKGAVFEVYRDAGLLAHHPATMVFGDTDPITAATIAGLPAPYFVKAAAQDATRPLRDLMVKVDDPERAVGVVRDRLADYRRVIVQGAASGRQVGVSVLRTPAGATVVKCVLDGHAKPHSNGTMSLRYSWWHDGMVADALRRLDALGWIGCAMVEYVWDEATDEFAVIEINPRFWQYLHLDLHAGVDFPRLLADWYIGGVEPAQPTPTRGVGCRDLFPGEIAMLVTRLRDADARWREKAATLAGFVANCFRPSLKSDLSFPGDRRPYFAEALRFLRAETSVLAGKLHIGKAVGQPPAASSELPPPRDRRRHPRTPASAALAAARQAARG